MIALANRDSIRVEEYVIASLFPTPQEEIIMLFRVL